MATIYKTISSEGAVSNETSNPEDLPMTPSRMGMASDHVAMVGLSGIFTLPFLAKYHSWELVSSVLCACIQTPSQRSLALISSRVHTEHRNLWRIHTLTERITNAIP